MKVSLSMTVLEYLQNFYWNGKRRVLATQIQYEIQVLHLNRFFRSLGNERDVTLEDLSDDLIGGCMAWLVDKGRSLSTANKVPAAINAIWTKAARALAKLGIVILRPDNEKYRVDFKEPYALTKEKFNLVLHTASKLPGKLYEGSSVNKADWWDFYIRLTYNCMGRVSAMLGIPTANLDLVRGRVLVPSEVQKQHADQWIKLYPRTIQAAQRLQLKQRGVPTVLGDWPYVYRTLNRHWSLLLVAAGICESFDDVPRSHKLHLLRKTPATHTAMKVGINRTSEIIGHSSPMVTRGYVDTTQLEQPSMADYVDDPSGEPPLDSRPQFGVVSAEADAG